MLDCLIIGMNEFNYENYIRMIRSLGEEKPPYRDLNLAFVEYEGKAYRCLDLINHFRAADKKLHNWDFLWPVVMYLGSYLVKRGYSMDYVNHFHLEKEKLKEKLVNNEILAIAITTTLAVIPHPVMEVIQFARQYNPSAKIIVGGPYILNQAFKELYNVKNGSLENNNQLQDFFNLIGADFYVIGAEGEKALVDLIDALKNNRSLDSINNIAYKKGKEFIITGSANEFNPLEDNMIDYSLFPPGDFGHYLLTRTTKSCPFRCAFCDFPLKAGKYSYLSPELVEKELNAIEEIGTIKDVSFVDDTFNVPRDRFKKILKIMIRNKYSFKWNSYLRCSHMDEECVQLMKESGCEGVFLGIESGSDTMLKRMDKRTGSDINKKYLRLLKEAGIITHANFIIGFPGETGATIKETIEFIEESKPDFFRAQLWYADPITPVWGRKDELHITGAFFDWSHYTMDSAAACNYLEDLFLNIKNSLWLPQWGFELWSVFYLRHMGMSLEKIKHFIASFNLSIKQKLADKTKKGLTPGMVEELKEICRF